MKPVKNGTNITIRDIVYIVTLVVGVAVMWAKSDTGMKAVAKQADKNELRSIENKGFISEIKGDIKGIRQALNTRKEDMSEIKDDIKEIRKTLEERN